MNYNTNPMKHQPLKFISFIIVFLLYTMTMRAGYVYPTRTMQIPATIDKIVFDGIDNESSYSDAQTLSIFNPTGYFGPEDFSGYFKVCWDERFLYFYANITDDVNHSFPNSSNGDTWMYDNIEIYIDLDTSGDESYYTDHTIQIRYNRGWNRVMWPGRAMAADYFCHLSNKADSTGWILETAIPWTCALPNGSLPEDINEYLDNAIGFDICFSDSDGDNPLVGMRDAMSAWDTDEPNDSLDRTEDNAWNNRKIFGIVEFLGNPLPAPTEVPPPPPVDPPFVTDPTPPPTPVAEIVNYVQPITKMNIPATKDIIHFDGADDESSYSPAQVLTTFYSADSTDDIDFSGYFKTCWDSIYLYFYAKITDNIDNSSSSYDNYWAYDCIEVFLDLDTNSAGPAYDENTGQVRFNRGWQRVSWTGGRVTADDFYYYSANTQNNDGWIVEAAIPWRYALPTGSTTEDIQEYIENSMGFDVEAIDSDNGDQTVAWRESMSAWDMDVPDGLDDRTEDNAWNNTRVFGIVELLGNPIVSPPPPPPAPPGPVPEPDPDPDPVTPPATGDNFVQPIRSMYIPLTADSMIMDGIANESSYSTTQTLVPFNWVGLDGTPDDFDGFFKVCWDYTYLYFFADITDDINHSVPDENSPWMYDNIEVYLDLAIDAEHEYYDDNSIQIRINRGIDYVIWPGRAEREEYIYHWENKPDNSGWVVEVAIPWTAALPEGKESEDIADYINNNMGFDVIFSDSDGDDPSIGMRDVGMAWDPDEPWDMDDRTEDNAWNNTHVFGVVNLLASTTLPVYRTHQVHIKPVQVTGNINVYPNPSSGIVYFENLGNVRRIEILNILGGPLVNIEVNDESMMYNLKEICREGIYVARFVYEDGTTSTQKLILH